ncbi:S-formylglutathione hydrolase [Stenotrophomonas maltophilia]|jgi:S-formylglutathione hydrolase|uniref:S-formylglutathione hydrolase n=1 Tax=Stenotrophomonas pavanii TaxID=487698 RepID=A0A246KVB0_9GAMM|nr:MULTISPECIES: S-formylglutathione hydrolase [Stenotrophomonas]EKT2104011.1 S-formylglutathione hydrolase [Stenotrophomonas maltophilia]EKU9957728.1 S-formylglutathione hydrolase [Stenotrophomonas maltophilia]EKU9974409.1 S-formylglutathione hydrolase [Stenotrophomonas maltophilia]EKU9983882.1 S-formylglutathione hydrolase [Stenotrophomonas maltophilia]EMF60653.1 S-formylglutathione hydrolase [Stenotrophomonas maltophilia EPM1]
MERIERHASFGGWQDVYQHESSSLGCTMKFGVYLPPQASSGPVPVLYWLSGLTCTEQNFITKSAVQQLAAEHGIAIVAPDTSPRGESVADDPAYDLGQGAGFYVNATEAPWSDHYRMYDYVVSELPALVEKNFPVSQARSISGHSMGGHGALVIALRNPGRYRSVSAFSPIVAPTQVPWGQKAFSAYLGGDQEQWRQYDAVELIADAKERLPLLVDQGLSDDFLQNQLRPELLRDACAKANHPLSLNLRDGYDHSYYFISSFIADHLKHHASALST